MNDRCFVTSIDSPEPLRWGLELNRIAVPMVLCCSREMADVLDGYDAPPHVTIVAADLPPVPSVRDRLAVLRDAGRAGGRDARAVYWLDSRLIYQHLSFEFLYGDLLLHAVERFAPGPRCFLMPGYEPGSFFGGPTAAIEALADAPEDELFEAVPGRRPVPVFPPAFDAERSADLNLSLAAAIDPPVLHVIGDSHVYNCFTPNRAIGCRANVLVRTPDVSPTRVPYAYQFTHHLGSRTMHFAGRPGALGTVVGETGVKAGDAIVWVFGEIDARCHVVRQHAERGRSLDEVIETLTGDYIREVLEVQRARDGLRTVVFAPIPPLDNPAYTSSDFPVFGRIEERVDATRRLRAALAARCARAGLLCLDVSAPYESARGDLRWELSDHFCHIASGSQAPVVAALYDLLAREASAAPAGPVSSPSSG